MLVVLIGDGQSGCFPLQKGGWSFNSAATDDLTSHCFLKAFLLTLASHSGWLTSHISSLACSVRLHPHSQREELCIYSAKKRGDKGLTGLCPD